MQKFLCLFITLFLFFSYPAYTVTYDLSAVYSEQSLVDNFQLYEDYTQREPFEDSQQNDFSTLSLAIEYPPDPGDMPVTDGILLLILLAVLYCFFLKKIKVNTL